MAGCVKKKCSCDHKFQDEKYGKQIRIHNVSLSGTKCKCTVCGKER